MAAVYLDGGAEAAHKVTRKLFEQSFSEQTPGERDYKTRVQELLQSRGKKVPSYEIESKDGPDHARVYHVVIVVDGQPFARGEGRSKLEAEQAAAAEAVRMLAIEADQSEITER